MTNVTNGREARLSKGVLIRVFVLAWALASCRSLAAAQEAGGTVAAVAGYCRGDGATAKVEGGPCLSVQLLTGLAADWRAGLSLSSAWLAGTPAAGLYATSDHPPVHAADVSLVAQRHWEGGHVGVGFGIVSARHRDIDDPQSSTAPFVVLEAGTSWGTGRVRPAARVAYDIWLSDFIAAEWTPSRVLRISLGVEVGFEPDSR